MTKQQVQFSTTQTATAVISNVTAVINSATAVINSVTAVIDNVQTTTAVILAQAGTSIRSAERMIQASLKIR